MKTNFSNKRILVTGACGTIGRELTGQLLNAYQLDELVALDNNESELFFLEQEFAKFSNAHFFLADIRDKDKLCRIMDGIDIVFHTAAYKHVILCERSPLEAVQTNIIGVQNIIDAAVENKVEKVLFTSSDKAVNPTNVMGTSKLMGERLISAANSSSRRDETILSSTRFGNVLGSRGSVIPIFREQILKGGPVTLTDPAMTRFIMSIQDAVQMVIDSALLACGGEVFVTKMDSIFIKDLAEVMIQELSDVHGFKPDDIKIKVIGTKPGEKMYEELLNTEETRRAWELERYFAILPAFRSIYRDVNYDYKEIISKEVSNPYHSDNESPLPKGALAAFLKENHLLTSDNTESEHPAE
jgi:FlaA1/EpsC-like NDP-sugar epimerase